MLSPKRYWRIAQTLEQLQIAPKATLILPANLTQQSAPPKTGDGIVMAAYDEATQTGIIRHIGIVSRAEVGAVEVDWRAVEAQIWVDTPAGRGFWKQLGGFCFAARKLAGCGLHQLFADRFDGVEIREALPQGAQTVRAPRATSSVSRQRLDPMEVIGEANDAPRGGYIYVLQSAYGYKVGRTINMPNRMRTFGVQLPFTYTIPLCAWFDDHYTAETEYHQLFSQKHINGEWFALDDADLTIIRRRAFA